MRRTNKAGDWQELIVLSDYDLRDPVPGADFRGPAVRVTFARYGREIRFSHTPGVIEEDGSFRPIQHLHHRNMGVYQDLFWGTTLIVKVAREIGPEVLAANSYDLKLATRSALREITEGKHKPEPRPKKEPKPAPPPIKKPSLGASIGEMIKAKQK